MPIKNTMHNGGTTGWISAIVLALLLNAMMFGLMPGLMVGVPDFKESPPIQNAIDIFRIKRPEPPIPDKQKPKPKEKEKPPEEKKIAKETVQQKPTFKPRLPFEINSRLPAGPGIVPTLAMEKYTTRNLGIFTADELDRPPQALSQVLPRYPLRADQMRIEGWVTIKFIITENGHLEQVEVLDSEPQGIFEKAVLSIIPLWRFSVPTVGGEPVKTFYEKTFRFNFENE